ncbi:glycogen phosphorylase [PVC group bacterium (ex Bugula neritina AB1)]|nr:glycogen phosphorylase [PVC group bacterium (ex Bugula neritina AB1)]
MNHSSFEEIFEKENAKTLSEKEVCSSISRYLTCALGKDSYTTTRSDWFKSISFVVRERLINMWLNTQRSYYKKDTKRVYYFSMEFLMGRSLSHNILNLGVKNVCENALYRLGQKLENIQEVEVDAGLGNGGLGRLASCFLDSMATQNIAGYGYGLRYEFGAFCQQLVGGEQVENTDYWLQFGHIWEIERPENMYKVRFGGVVKDFMDDEGQWRHVWLHDHAVNAVAYDTPIPGYLNQTVNTLRLWSAKAIEQFNLSFFNKGDYIKSLEEQIKLENISRVLYPDDTTEEGKKLIFKQQYFFISASLQDILRRFKKSTNDFNLFSKKVAIQLNDTHPALSILELMRIFLDIEGFEWKFAWKIVTETFSYTNHTILPEALEKWPMSFFQEILPRHLQILYEINRRFLKNIERDFSKDGEKVKRMSLIEEGEKKMVRMSHLAIVGSHCVNGVSQLHTDILKKKVFVDFYQHTPKKFVNVTNGISVRRWLLGANPELSALISEVIGDGWKKNIEELSALESFAKDQSFQEKWKAVKLKRKKILINHVQKFLNISVSPEALFDVQIKRIHEYKRQVLKIMHVIHLYASLKKRKKTPKVSRAVFFSGKAAPSYEMAKTVIHLINAVATEINNDKDVRDFLKVIFIPNYGVTLAEKIIPAADLSEQISTAGMEASGTGNMKLALNGALMIGTLDGANVEMQEHIGDENMFIFGLKALEIEKKRKDGYDPYEEYLSNQDLCEVIDMIDRDVFSRKRPGIFKPIINELLRKDYFCNTLDFKEYLECQQRVDDMFFLSETWTEKAILNVSRMAYFSSDRAILEYSKNIWGID